METNDLVFALAAMHSFSCSGIIFGYPFLSKSFIHAGQYSEYCTGIIPCNEQNVRFAVAIVAGCSAFFTGSLIHAIILSFWGPKIDSCIATFLVFFGSLITAVSDSPTFDGFVAGIVLIGLGGSGVHLSFFHFAILYNDVPKMQSVVVGALVGSALIYICFAELILSGADKLYIFVAHSIWLFLMIILASRLQPMEVFKKGEKAALVRTGYIPYVISSPKQEITETPSHNVKISSKSSISPNEGESYCALSSDEVAIVEAKITTVSTLDENSTDEGRTSSNSEKFENVSGPGYTFPCSLWNGILDYRFSVGLIFLTVHIFRFNFYTSTILLIMNSYNSGDRTVTLYVFLLFLFLSLGFLSTFLINGIISRYGLPGGFAATNFLGLFYGILVMIHNQELQILTFIIFSVHRMFIFSCYYPYLMKVFGPKLFGLMSGLSLFIAGSISLIQIPLILIVERFNGGKYFEVNLVTFTILPVLMLPFPRLLGIICNHIDNLNEP